MKITHLLEAGVQPTEFPSVKRNADRVFGGDLGFYIVEKDNPANRSEFYSYKENDIENDKDIQESEKKTVLDAFIKKYNLRPNEVKVVTVDAATPEFDDRGRLLPNRAQTYSQRVQSSASDYKDRRNNNIASAILDLGGITVENVKEIIAEHPDANKHAHMNSLLDKLIAGSGRPWVPQVIVDGINDNKIIGTDLAVGKYLADFGEIAGPIGLVCSSINGNAGRVLPNFFGESGRAANLNNIKSEAVIHYHPSKGHALVDSYIEYRGNVVRVSSKAAGDKMSGGAGATFAGIYQSIAEIATTDEGRNAFNGLMRKRPGAREGLRKLKILANVLVDDDGDSGRSVENFDAFKTKLTLLQELLKNTSANKYKLDVTNSDIAILQLLWNNGNPRQTSIERFHRFKAIIGLAFGSRVDSDIVARDAELGRIVTAMRGKKFSPGFFNLVRSFKLNIFGEPTTGGTEDPNNSDEYNKVRGWWLRLKKSIVFAVADQVNSDPEFSMLCTWILNHGKFIQIDTRSAVRNGALLITNITATWPSTAVDRVQLVPNAVNSGFKYKLHINSDRDWRDNMNQNYKDSGQASDYADANFGFSDTQEKMKMNRVDLARMNRHWESLIQAGDELGNTVGSDDRRAGFTDPRARQSNADNRRSNSKLKIDNLFSELSKLGMITQPTNSDEENRAVDTIVTAILSNTLTTEQHSYTRRAVEYTLQYLHAASKKSDEYINVNEADDEDDDEETVQNLAPITRPKRQIGVDDLARAHELLWPIHYAFEIYRAILRGADYSKLRSELGQSLEKLGISINVDKLIKGRRDTTNHDVDNFTPATAKAKKETMMTPSSITSMITFLNKYDLIEKNDADVKPIGNSTARTYRFCAKILMGSYDSRIAQISKDFAALLQDDNVRNIISWETRNSKIMPSFDQINHPDNIYNTDLSEATGPRGYVTEETVLQSITLIYWTLVVKRYQQIGQARNNNIKFVNTLNTLQSFANGIIRDRHNRDEFMRALRAIKAGGGQQVFNQQQQNNVVRPTTSTQSLPSYNERLSQVRAAFDLTTFRKYASDIEGDLRNGLSAKQVIDFIKNDLKESRSAILRGLLHH